MGTISDKLTYLNTTKTNLKDMINYGLPSEEQITSSTTFRNYVSSIFEAFLESLRDSETLYTNLPKKSGNGTQITLNGTANAPMRITLNPTAITQDGTPTPSSPQDIHTISGSNSIVVEGKNLFDKSTATQNKIINRDSGTTSTINNYYASDYIIVEPGESYTYSNFNYWYSAYYDKNKNYVDHPTNTATLTIPSGIKYIRISCETSKIDIAQFEKGSTATTYEPYQSNTQTIDLSTYNLGSIGNYENRIFKNIPSDTDYSSEREEGGWYYKEGIGKVVLDGSESWNEDITQKIAGIRLNNIYYNYDITFTAIGMSNRFIGGTLTECRNNANIFSTYDNSINNLWLNKQNLSLNDFKTWLSNNNTIVYYPLATPTYTKLTDTALINQLENIYKNMLSYKGTTNISQVNNDLPFTLSVSALEDLS